MLASHGVTGMVSYNPGVTALPDCRGRSLGERRKRGGGAGTGRSLPPSRLPSLRCAAHSLVKEREGERERRERASALCFKLHSLGSSLNSSGSSNAAAASLSVRQKTEAALWWFAIRAPSLSLSVIATYPDSTAVDESTVERDFLR